jgi:hypothetical protein
MDSGQWTMDRWMQYIKEIIYSLDGQNKNMGINEE